MPMHPPGPARAHGRCSPRNAALGLWTKRIALVVSIGLTPAAVVAQASPLVPVLDPAYHDLDALAGVGLVRDLLAGQRPYSRMTFARYVLEAESRMAAEAAGPGRKARFAEALGRLRTRFSPEYSALCAGETSCAEPANGFAVRSIRSDATWADSPNRPAYTAYNDEPRIDADINPLLQSDEGRHFVDGGTGAVEATVEGQLGRSLALQVSPRATLMSPTDLESEADLGIRALNIRGVIGNLAVEVGRSAIFHGQGRIGGPVLSANSPNLDLVRIQTERPFRLPSVLGLLGPMSASAFLADMGEDRHIPNAKLFVMEVSARPSPYFEFGGTLANVQAGQGGPEATFGDRLRDSFLWLFLWDGRPNISDKIAAVDSRLTLPGSGLSAYLEATTTDINFKRTETLWDEAVWTAGLDLVGRGPEGRLDMWLEGRRTGVRPHTHHQYESGVTVNRLIVGDPGGPMSLSWQGGVTWNGDVQTLAVSGAWERYSGDVYRNNGRTDTEFRWNKISDEPDEIRLRGMAEWSHRPNRLGVTGAVRLGVERVQRFAFSTTTRSNLLLQARVGYAW